MLIKSDSAKDAARIDRTARGDYLTALNPHTLAAGNGDAPGPRRTTQVSISVGAGGHAFMVGARKYKIGSVLKGEPFFEVNVFNSGWGLNKGKHRKNNDWGPSQKLETSKTFLLDERSFDRVLH